MQITLLLKWPETKKAERLIGDALLFWSQASRLRIAYDKSNLSESVAMHVTTNNSTMMQHPNTEVVTFSSEVRSDVKLKFGLSHATLSEYSASYFYSLIDYQYTSCNLTL